jgi:hypothetical protein
MKTWRRRSSPARGIAVAGTLAGVLAAGAAGAGTDAGCQPVFDALMSVYTTPTHLVTTESGPGIGAPRVNETIFTAEAIYVKTRRGWVKSPMSPREMAEQQKQNQAHARSVSCKALREEAVDGEAATVYSSHSESEESVSDSLLWISKRSGRPLREELDLDVGGKGGKTHHSSRFDHRDVHPPAGVR